MMVKKSALVRGMNLADVKEVAILITIGRRKYRRSMCRI
jgi:hypothetical protein